MNKHLICLLFSLMSLCYSDAHVDKIIELKDNKLIGLPGKYSPATFIEDKRTLTVGENEVIIPNCIWKHLFQKDREILEITSSWYHHSDTLPPYIALSTKKKDELHEITLLIDLNTLGPLYFYKTITTQTGEKSFSSYSEDIPIEAGCVDGWKVTSRNKK